VWLQQFAWTEQSHEAKIRKRNAMPEDECLIEAEPMFCFETAVKLLYWSGFVYEDDEVTFQTEEFVSLNIKRLSITTEKHRCVSWSGGNARSGKKGSCAAVLEWSCVPGQPGIELGFSLH